MTVSASLTAPTKTMKLFEKIESCYWRVVPYEWRPGQIWYCFKCWAWHRYTTVKPRKLGHTWSDKTHLIPHVLFEMLCDFVEKELRDGHVDWDAFPDQADARDRMETLYKWWTEEYDEWYPWNLSEEELNDMNSFQEEEKYQKELLDKCKEIIDLSPYMWT